MSVAEAAAPRAQLVRCGPLRVAVPYAWARSVVEEAALVPAPGAPAWLAGAANIDGRIVPVVDLAAWVDPAAPAPAARARLLLGGDGDERLALRFEGLPTMVRVEAGAADRAAALPGPLQPYHRGDVQADGALHPVIDLPALVRAWIAELAAEAAV